MLKIVSGAKLCMRSIVPNSVRLPLGNVTLKDKPVTLHVQFVRNTSFFNRLTQADLWRGVTSVSNAGKRRGRGRLGDRKGKRNLNEGQTIGDGQIAVLWPGLNYNVMAERGVAKIRKLPENEQRVKAPVQTKVKVLKSKKIHPLERGWTARSMKGRRIGCPDPIQDETFEDFESVVLDAKLVTTMSSIMGRKRKYFSVVATGNGNGVIGVGVAQAIDLKSCINLAKNRAARRLITIDLVEKHLVNHDFFSEYGRTRVTVFKKPEGFGLYCHRIINALCKLIGIENLYAKVEGASNPKHIIRAFIIGLHRQKSYQEIADEKKLHLVEFREETFNFPQVLASPQECLTPEEARKDPVTFNEYIMGGKLVYDKGPKVPFYKKLPSWRRHLKKSLFHRNHDKVKLELLAKYGACASHLTKVYPECKRPV